MHSATSRLSFVFIIFTLHFSTTTTNADVPRPRGVSLVKSALYQPGADKSWTCLDGSKTIRYVQINDDYCDCEDGSDEPGTAACAKGQFHCSNVGYRSIDIPSNRVNDGICDCCDGSDEYSPETGDCSNTCQELGRVEQEQRKTEAELHKRGASKRGEMITKGKQLKADREIRRAELDRRRNEQEAIKAEKEQLKRNAEAAEAEALELYKEQQSELDASAGKTEEQEGAGVAQVEAQASFVRYDVNKDGFVEVTELQVDMTLDRDRNGVVTIEEAKYFLDERDRIDLNDFLALSWPRIKPLKMLADGLFKPPIDTEKETDTTENVEEHQQQQPPNLVEGSEGQDLNENDEGEHQPENEEFADEEEEEIYEDDDADVGVGSVTADEPKLDIEYDPETQRLIEVANEARSAYSEVEREIREIENEIKEIDDQNAKDYGPNEEYAGMDGECYTFEDREYVYTLCPFERASQKQRSGGSETTLGRWDQWEGEGENKYARQRYSHGASCWNGPQRSALIHLKCALEHKITSVTEPNRCEYLFEFETPAACDETAFAAKDVHDEL